PFKITNVGTAKSSPTTATIQTLSPPPPNPQSVTVPALSTGKSFVFDYSLAADCDTQQVQVVVPQATDANPADNTLRVAPCVPPSGPLGGPPPPARNQGVVGSLPCDVVSADPLTCTPARNSSVVGSLPCDTVSAAPLTCPGTHEVDLQPKDTYTQLEGASDCDATPPEHHQTGVYLVGWYQDEDVCYVEVAETAVRFDMGVLDQIPSRLIAEAKVVFDETQLAWWDTDGSPRGVDGCVSAIGIATVDWTGPGPLGDLIQNDTYQDYTPANVHEFVVTVPFAQQLANQAPRWGFVLRGAIEPLNQLEGHGRSSCESIVSNIRMHVT